MARLLSSQKVEVPKTVRLLHPLTRLFMVWLDHPHLIMQYLLLNNWHLLDLVLITAYQQSQMHQILQTIRVDPHLEIPTTKKSQQQKVINLKLRMMIHHPILDRDPILLLKQKHRPLQVSGLEVLRDQVHILQKVV